MSDDKIEETLARLLKEKPLKMHRFAHNPSVKAGCCNYQASRTYWMASSREQAKEEIKELGERGDREPRGLCADCMAILLSEEDYIIVERD